MTRYASSSLTSSLICSPFDLQASANGSKLSKANIDDELDPSEGNNIAAITCKKGHLWLTDQHGHVQCICTIAIKELLMNTCIKNVYPDGPKKSSNFAKAALILVVKDLKYNDITKRLQTDDDYASKLALIVSCLLWLFVHI